MTGDDWTKDSQRVATFFSMAEELAIENPLLLLGVEDLEDFRGTMSEALAILNGEANALQLQDAVFSSAAQLAEVPVTANTKFRSPNGAVWQVTIRPVLPVDQMVAAMKSMVLAMQMFESAVVKGRGWVPVQHYSDVTGGKGRPEPERRAQGQSQSRSGNGTGQPQGEIIPDDDPSNHERIRSGLLQKLMIEGDVYTFLIQGARFPVKDSRGLAFVLGKCDDSVWDVIDREDLVTDDVKKLDHERGDLGSGLMITYGKHKTRGWWNVLAITAAGD